MTERSRRLEERLAGALADGAEAAPGVVGLADGARRRASARRRRRTGAAVVAAAGAVVAVVVPLAVVGGGSRDGVVPGEVSDGWRTVLVEADPWAADVDVVRILVDVPAAWVPTDTSSCPFYDFVAPGLEPGSEGCAAASGVGAGPSGLFDSAAGPGLRSSEEDPGWSGYVELGDLVVTAAATDELVGLRVLASARLEGDPTADVSGPWTEAVLDGVAYRVPAGVPLDIEVTATPVDPEVEWASARQTGQEWWRAAASVGDDRRIVVDGPSEALVELVAGSADVDEASRLPPGSWRTTGSADVRLEVPADWGPPSRPCAGAGVVAAQDESTTTGCAPAVWVSLEAAIDWSGDVGLRDGGGAVRVDDHVVMVESDNPAVVRRVLASARPTGSAPVDVDTWTRIDLGDGITAEVPVGGDVDVRLLAGTPSCSGDLMPARPDGDRWTAGLCRDRIVRVTAPTQALADVVASTVRGH